MMSEVPLYCGDRRRAKREQLHDCPLKTAKAKAQKMLEGYLPRVIYHQV